MNDREKTKKQLLDELALLRERVNQLESAQSDSKHVGETLMSNEDRFQSVVESSPMGIFVYELVGDRLVFRGANPAADSILGVDCTQFIGKTIEEAFPPLLKTDVPEKYKAAARNGQSSRWEEIDYDHEGITGAFEVWAFQIAPGLMACMFSDITERKKQEADLQRSEARLRAIFEAATDVAFIMIDLSDGQDRMIDFSPGAERIFDYHREEVLGRRVGMLHIKEDARELPRLFESMRQYAEGFKGEWTMVRKSGEEFKAFVTMHPIFDSNENVNAALNVCIELAR